MNELFYVCVDLLKRLAAITGMTYEEVNIWVFVIIHPLITLILLIILIVKSMRNGKKV